MKKAGMRKDGRTGEERKREKRRGGNVDRVKKRAGFGIGGKEIKGEVRS